MKFTLLYIVLVATNRANCQCDLSIKGSVRDSLTGQKIFGATFFVIEKKQYATSDSTGQFKIDSLCPGAVTLVITSVGYDSLKIRITLNDNTEKNFSLYSVIRQLQGVEVSAERNQDIATNAKSEIKGNQLFQTAGLTLGESLKGIPGLNSIQTGPSISKPVIHGLHSNRILILNNGIRQEGQQWGSEHAPEIDPFIADKITIIKGAASVRYGSDAIVGVLLVEPRTLSPDKKIEGETNLVLGMNGRSAAVSSLLQGNLTNKLSGVNWRVQGTLKQAGNFRTSDYYLKNTGLKEGDYSLAISYKDKKDKLETGVYYSSFNTKVGIFEGSHVGNASDLYAAFSRPKPITASYFSYDMQRTYQQISHQLLKINSQYKLNNKDKIEIVYASQNNKRDEYDIDLPYSSDPTVLKTPQISFRIKTQSLDLLYHQEPKHNFYGLYGISGTTQGNVFRGIRYLIPNFRNYNGGAFAIERYTKNSLTLEAGVRYDSRWLRVYRINNTTLVTYHTTSSYQNLTGTIGSSYRFSNRFSLSANIGSAWRAPSVNELYIDGIHLSAASYEKGDSTLRSERSYNFTFSGKYEFTKLYAEMVIYDNIINDFIYAKPTLQPITLISGTYPLFNYTQANVNLKGLDAEVRYSFLRKLSLDSKISIVRGCDKSLHDYLIFMPADRFDNSIRFDIGAWNRVKKCYATGGILTVLKQTRVPPNSDYVPPPNGYSLLNASIGCEWPFKKNRFVVDLSGYNLSNTAYRDYLNRFRYYANDLGINIVLRMKLVF